MLYLCSWKCSVRQQLTVSSPQTGRGSGVTIVDLPTQLICIPIIICSLFARLWWSQSFTIMMIVVMTMMVVTIVKIISIFLFLCFLGFWASHRPFASTTTSSYSWTFPTQVFLLKLFKKVFLLRVFRKDKTGSKKKSIPLWTFSWILSI